MSTAWESAHSHELSSRRKRNLRKAGITKPGLASSSSSSSDEDEDDEAESTALSVPFLVCDVRIDVLAHVKKEEMLSTFGRIVSNPIYNDAAKTCFQIYTVPSVALNAPTYYQVQPYHPLLKQASDFKKVLSEESISKDDKIASIRFNTAAHLSSDDIVTALLASPLPLPPSCGNNENAADFELPVISHSKFRSTTDLSNLKTITNECLHYIIDTLIALPSVTSVSAQIKPVSLNQNSQWIGQSADTTTKAVPFYDAGLTGEGQVVQVSDTGLDEDNCYFLDTGKVKHTTRENLVDGGTISTDLSKRKVVQVRKEAAS
jgi:hypothetical protein